VGSFEHDMLIASQQTRYSYVLWLLTLTRAQRRRPALQLTSALPAIGISTLLVGTWGLVMGLFDEWTIAEVRRLPKVYVDVFEVITDFGRSGWLLFPLLGALVLLVIVSSRTPPAFTQLVIKSISTRCWFLFLAIAVPGLFTLVGKHLIGRARPYVTAGDAYVFAPFAWHSQYGSLPSGHSTTAFAAAVAIGAVWRGSRMLVWAYAVLIGTSRVIVTAHFPSDVFASAAVGVIGALLVRNYFACHGRVFSIWTNGTLHPFPGPSFSRAKGAFLTLFLRFARWPRQNS
jgi:membrane-associated phospholipid phosphatase